MFLTQIYNFTVALLSISLTQLFSLSLSQLSELDQRAMTFDIALIRIKFNDKIRYCCGTPLSPNLLLSAAHCFFNEPEKHPVKLHRIRVLVMENSKRLRPKKLIIHPSYNDSSLNKDVALLALMRHTSFNFNQNIPRKFGTGSHAETVGERCVLYGHWNNRYVAHIDDSNLCKRQLEQKNITYDDKNMICAGKNDKHHSCFGDSGCPLLCDRGIVGLISFSTTCNSGSATILTRMTEVRDWIFSFLPKM